MAKWIDPTFSLLEALVTNSIRCSRLKKLMADFVRIVPVVLKAWFRELEGNENCLAFPSVRGRPLTRNGVNYILQQAIAAAAEKQPSLRNKKISPHSMRHYVSCRTISRKTVITANNRTFLATNAK